MLIFNSKSKQDKEEQEGNGPTKRELANHHVYEDEIAADGFLSPVVLPKTRFLELKGEDSLLEMSNKCHVSMRELSLLMENDYIEPTTSQLVAVSIAYNVSIFWLLGYHTMKEAHGGSADRDILMAINRRNSIEQARQRMKKTGVLAEYFHNRMGRRIMKANLDIASVAAHNSATEHVPLDEQTLRRMTGQPVFVEQVGRDSGTWGVVEEDSIHILKRDIPFSELGNKFEAYQMPRVMKPTLY